LPGNLHQAASSNAQPPSNAASLIAGGKTPGNATTPLAGNASSHNAAPTTAVNASAAPQSQPPAVPLAGLAVAIAGRSMAGKNRFEIRLDPPELGRIEVRLDVDKDGHVTSHLIADRKDTLNLLQSDASGLQRALQNAGLKTADNGLQFSLRDQSGGGQQQQNAPAPVPQPVKENETLKPIETIPANYASLARLRGGLDIRV
jgi:flagellar hook-length control protein FliK